jgi:hypothetical protein
MDRLAYEYYRVLPMYEIKNHSKIRIENRKVEDREKSYALFPRRGTLRPVYIPKSVCKGVEMDLNTVNYGTFEAWLPDWYIEKNELETFKTEEND